MIIISPRSRFPRIPQTYLLISHPLLHLPHAHTPLLHPVLLLQQLTLNLKRDHQKPVHNHHVLPPTLIELLPYFRQITPHQVQQYLHQQKQHPGHPFLLHLGTAIVFSSLPQ